MKSFAIPFEKKYLNFNKVLITTYGDQGLRIIDAPKQNGIFKSNIVRFKQKKAIDVPGPGSYLK